VPNESSLKSDHVMADPHSERRPRYTGDPPRKMRKLLGEDKARANVRFGLKK